MATSPAKPRRRLKAAVKWAVILAVVALIVVFRLVEEIGLDRQPSDRFIVKAIVDGDTMELLGGDRLRLLSIDTPEKGDPLYDQARQFLATLALGRMARIEYTGRRRDKYGRLLGYVYIDSVFINKAIIENGLGYLYLFGDTEINRPETRQLLLAQRAALNKKLGLWSSEKTSEDYYVASPNSFRFHRPHCRSLGKFKPGHHRRFETREQALYEGLSPCRRCKP